ncbi:LytR/AlgR family response regulator transcription factor [Algoriphagus chordae]|uniref:LytTR family two component transcriptional regulator n=1 Tax=Algoriphagus chordae TaxID=237019 RepID=A0A2W7RAG9_9BACT|nr:LytTR family transcriptional regulator DNA-binding domain-containing protein [Algoriphagus chordae]PZX47575.1 LytTR family two component transcriptional regulator [Algoriphagus chordae]
MNRPRILIVEDELIIAEDLKDILESLDYEVCGIATSAREAMQFLEEQPIDLALLDIKIKGGKDGIALAADIREQYRIPFVFLTSHVDTATLARAKETHPYGYLVKPFHEKDIHACLEVALSNYAAENEKKETQEEATGMMLSDSLFVRNNGMLVKVKFNDIIYFEADGNYSQVYTRDKKYVIRAILKDLEVKLNPNQFARIHKSFLINLEAIDAIDNQSVHISGKEIPISRSQHSWLVNQIKTL